MKESGHDRDYGHIKEKTKSRKRSVIPAFFVVAAALLILGRLRPWYVSYMEKSNTETCTGARQWIAEHYAALLSAEEESGAELSDARAEELLRQALESSVDGYSIVEGPTLIAEDICRAGGRYYFTIEPGTHRLVIECTHEGHTR